MTSNNVGGPTTPEAYYAMHQKAFRCAFDFLNAHFPPEDDPEWWLQAAKDVETASLTCEDMRLSNKLLAGVYDYLDEILKERRKADGGT